MKIRSNTDNIYSEGSLVTARDHSECQLVIESYRQKIYYCQVVGYPLKKSVYFEREIQPSADVILFTHLAAFDFVRQFPQPAIL